jgi:anti-sigma factor RsiW
MRDARHPEDDLSAFLDDELPEDAALAVARHVADCGHCQRELDDLRATRDALRKLPNVAPPSSLLHEVPTAARRRERHGRRVAVAATCVSLGVSGILTAAFVMGGQDGDVTPPVDVFVVDHVVRTGGGPVLTPVSFERP